MDVFVQPTDPNNPETVRLLSELDWGRTALGPVESWPAELRTLARLMVRSKSPQHLVWGPEQILLYNDGYIPVLGDRHPSAFGKRFAEVWPDIWDGVEPIVRQTYRGVADYFEDHPWLLDRGDHKQQVWISFAYTPIENEAGDVLGFHCTFHETTASVLARQELLTLVAQRQLALDAARLGWWQYNPTTGQVTHDARYAEIYGLSHQSPRQVDEISRLIHPDDAPRLWAAVNASLQPADARPYAADYRILRPDGELRWLEARGIATFEGEGESRRVANFVGTVGDITERRLAEEVLRENEARFRLMADASPATLWLTNPDGACTFLSRQWYEFTGQTEAEALGLGWTSATHPDDREAAGRAFLDANTAREFFQTEYRLRAADGSYRWAIDQGRPWYSETGDYAGMVGVVFDIDARKRAEQAVEDASRRKDQFLATLAHELRNPLAPISNALQVWPLLQHKPEEATRLREMVGRQVRQMIRLIDDLLDVSRITRGKIVLRKERLDLRGVLAGAVEAQKPLLEARRHAFDVDLSGDPITVDADTGRLVQVFGNLLHNAAKYTAPGGRIGLRAQRERDWAVVSVRDNGAGIPPHMLTAIFEMFTQVDQSLDRADGGLGIGLTLVRNLVDLHGGTVEARSHGPGHGSEFVVRLPLAEDELPAAEPAAEPRDSRPNPPRRRILVVDDVEPSANTLALMLEALGQTPRAVYDGMSALDAMRSFEPDIVFLDIAMPGMDGYELARRIRGTWPKAFLVALTGYGQEEDRRRAFEAGFDHHLIKPTQLDALRELLLGVG